MNAGQKKRQALESGTLSRAVSTFVVLGVLLWLAAGMHSDEGLFQSRTTGLAGTAF